MIARIDEARGLGNTVGGVFEVVASGVPVGLGSHVHWDRRLDAQLAAAICSIQSVKGVEFGMGFEQTRRLGSEVHDVIEGLGTDGDAPQIPGLDDGPVVRWLHRTNRAGGLTGGISNGEPIVVRGAVKPISTLARPLPSADLRTGEPVEVAHYERSDISVVPAAGVIGEAMVMLVLAGAVLDKFGGDSLDDVRSALVRYRERTTRRDGPIVSGAASGSAGAAERARPTGSGAAAGSAGPTGSGAAAGSGGPGDGTAERARPTEGGAAPGSGEAGERGRPTGSGGSADRATSAGGGGGPDRGATGRDSDAGSRVADESGTSGDD